jgi:hypothetical protein
VEDGTMHRNLCTALIGILAVISAAAAQAPPAVLPPAAAPTFAPPAAEVFPIADAPGGDRAWVEADFLLWWMKGAFLPPLVTTSPSGTPINQAGVIGSPGTAVIFGNSKVNDNDRIGGRATIGYWFNPAHDEGVEASFFMLESKGTHFAATSNGNPILGRPFIDANSGLSSAERIAFPGDITGSVQATGDTTGLLGASALFRENFYESNGFRLDWLGGYRYLRLSDRVAVNEQLTNVNPRNPNFIPVGANINVADSFEGRNDLHALDVGLVGTWQNGPLSLVVRAQFAIGFDEEVVNIAGATTVTVDGAPPAVSNGGLLALPSNIGHHSRDEISLVPEVNLKVAYQISPRLTASVGYSYLYWSTVARAGDQIDTTINPTLIPPPTNQQAGQIRPIVNFHSTAFWAQGVDLGLELDF